MKATERLFFTADKKKVVAEGDRRAAFLYAAPGDEIPDAAAEQFGLADGGLKGGKKTPDKSKPPAEDKSAKQGGDKAQKPAAKKSRKPAADKSKKPEADKSAEPEADKPATEGGLTIERPQRAEG